MAEHCQSCDKAYDTVWHAPPSIWALVTGKTGGNGLLCPSCFDHAAAERNMTLYWSCSCDRFPWPPECGEALTQSIATLVDVMLDTLNRLDAEYGPRVVDVNFPRLRKAILEKGMKR